MLKWRLIISLFIISNALFAQTNINLEKVQDEGLTNYYIKCIQQDKNGFLWFGTEEGLFRYNGYSFKPFKNFPGDSQTLINNDIEFLFPQTALLWVGSRGGLSCIDINTNKIKNFSAGEILTVYAIIPENDSIFWIGSSAGLFQFNKKKETWKRIPAIDKNVFIRSLCDDGHHLYITSHNGFYCYDKVKETCKHYQIALPAGGQQSFEIIHKSLLDMHGNVWMTSWRAGLIEFNPHTEKIKEWLYNKNDSNINQPYIRAFDILQEPDGNIWLANGENGVTIFNLSNHKITNYPITWDNENKFINKTYSLFRDRSGIFWIGTENGIYKYDPHKTHLSKINFRLQTNTGGLKSQLAPLCMLKDKDGLWWLGGYDGLYLLDSATGMLHNYTSKAGIPKSMLVTNILQDSSGTIWLASREMIIALTKKANGKSFSLQHTIYKSPDLKSVITSLYIDHENRMWIGTHSNGIFMFDQNVKKIIAYPYTNATIGSNKNEVRSFYEITKDSLLVGGEHTGLLLFHTNDGRYDKIRWNKKIAIRANDLTINAIVKMDNSFWIATDLNGLWKSDTRFQHVFRYNTSYGLPSMNITAILPDKRNHLWLLTEGGLVDFKPIADDSIPVIDQAIIYDKKDGLENLSALSSIIKDEANIAISDMGCIHILNPFQSVKNDVPPPVFITSFKIFDKERDFNNSKPIELNYNENYFSFEYVALNYTQPLLNMYAYKMEGLDTEWNLADTRRYISYAGLKEGTYTFKVKAGNNEGVWNNVPTTITLIIDPPYWHTWWFYSLITLCAGGILYSVYLMKLNQWKDKYRLRNKIARDLHDDIGSTLSGINIFSRIALQKINSDKTGSRELLEKISDRSKKTMDALSDIVWSINSKNDAIDNVLAKMQEYLSETLEPQNIKYDFKVDESIHHTKLDMEVRKDVYLIFKEAIHNACKYAQCSSVNISLRRKKESCLLTIQDDGKGFDISSVTPGNGIYNMQKRASKIRATISIDSKINKGTLITLEFHIT